MIYTVTIEAPAISETVTLAGETATEARRLALASALARQVEAATVTVAEVPDPPAAA